MSESDDDTVPAKPLLRGWAIVALAAAVGAYLFGGSAAFGTVIDVLVPATVAVSFGLLAWKYEVEH